MIALFLTALAIVGYGVVFFGLAFAIGLGAVLLGLGLSRVLP